MKLPQLFCEKMEALLGEKEYNKFIEVFEKPKFSGLRVNGLKCTREEFLVKYAKKVFESGADRYTFDGVVDECIDECVTLDGGTVGDSASELGLRKIPWCSQGLYFDSEQRPAKHPFYHAGLYYIQEPSAMLPGTVADAQPGERILDLCAAPGGKSTHVATGLQGEGLLVSNDINSERVKALVKNIELMGIKNAIVTCTTPEILAGCCVNYFDKILIDAPCSGEGMFRKDERAAKSWESFKTEVCADMQRGILKQADRMLKPGGVIIYSTCTFSPDENEKMMFEFLREHDNYFIEPITKVESGCGGIACGHPEWLDGMADVVGQRGEAIAESMKKTARIWPHKVDGEGHFTALLRKATSARDESSDVGGSLCDVGGVQGAKMFKEPNKNQKEVFDEFAENNLSELAISKMKNLFVIGQGLYSLPIAMDELPSFLGVKIVKYGWYLGEFKNDKFIPSQSMITALKVGDFKNVIKLNAEDRRVTSYLKGETLQIEPDEIVSEISIEGKKAQKALNVICADEFPLGWGKLQGCMLKNMYPKGWREMR